MVAKLSENANLIIQKRYLDKGEKTADDVFRRVTGGVPEYYEMVSELLMLPNSPTLFNLGTKSGGTNSACFVFDIDDTLLGNFEKGVMTELDMRSIVGTYTKAASVAKAGGGVGYYLGNIRPKGTEVNSVHRKACGPVQVLHFLHGLRSLITQGGKRDLAQMGVLPCSHPDIMEFIHCKNENPKALESFNISVSWTDEYLRHIDFDAILSVDNGKGINFPIGNPTAYNFYKLWSSQALSAWQTGDPGMLFYDTINRFNATPHLGNINATNPCGETPNLSDEPCNLGSLALRRFVTPDRKGVDWKKLKHYTRVAINYLDWILDNNTFPYESITKAALATRKLGLGVMGWADMLAILKIPYDSESAVQLGEEIMKTINHEALKESVELGLKKGNYPAWETGSNETKASFPACRNSTRTSIAPTGTISILAECEPSIEPHYALERTRTINEGNKLTERIDDWLGDLGGFVPKTANEIHYTWHIKHQAAFQKHTNLGVSKTVNLPKTATVKDVSDAYAMMWRLGCKGGTIFRDGCRSEQVLVAKEQKSVYTTTNSGGGVTVPKKRKLPKTRSSITHKFEVSGTKVYFTIGLYSDGQPGEIFIRASKNGSTIGGMLDTWASSFSSSLQHGTPLETLVKLHKNSRFEPSGLTGDKDIPNCTSIPDYIVRWMEKKFIKIEQESKEVTVSQAENNQPIKNNKSGMICPDCGIELISHGGCLQCTSCSFSKC